ncbi:pantothenate kinase 4 [Westerdykella ornata]|uniref:Pantothenate kinase 4 n=1 Tax=Westerdykella ornata TaxID=318751 RepID=A0A6A6JD10_WESOR|nr:pantothenate kinase 4 [Westerdykella ornata]KAF2274155.1 pantothenate kinase 4 [Westerdykella ornata]
MSSSSFSSSTPAPAPAPAPSSPRQSARRRLPSRSVKTPSQCAVEETIQHPGAVRINVQGAFISTDDEPTTPRSEDYTQDPHDIRLPNHTGVVSHIAVDIGGSLAKLVYFSQESTSASDGGRLNFVKFETANIEACIDFMRNLQAKYAQHNGNKAEDLCVMATGGGAFKYYDRIREALGVEVIREDEMECLIIGARTLNRADSTALEHSQDSQTHPGLDFFITEIPDEVFTYTEDSPMGFVPRPQNPSDSYPYLLVNIGSGVSMIKVSGPRQFERIGGTSLGGGTLWGLLSLLTGARSFDDMLRLSESGDNAAVDLLVGDIYGSEYNKIGLKATHIASSMGKVYKMKREAERKAEDGCSGKNKFSAEENRGANARNLHDDLHHPDSGMFRPEDISRSLLYAVSNNIGQIAYLHAEKHGLRDVYFGGSFIGGHSQTMHTLSYAINFWSKGTKQAYFLRHEGYLGSVGAFVKRQPPNWGRRASFESRGLSGRGLVGGNERRGIGNA